jgi:hypothetical protein
MHRFFIARHWPMQLRYFDCRCQSIGVGLDKIAKSMLLALNAENAADMPAFVKVPALAGSVGRDENV